MNASEQPSTKLMGSLSKTHFQQYQVQNYTKCAKNNMTSKHLTHISTEYTKNTTYALNTQQVLVLPIFRRR